MKLRPLIYVTDLERALQFWSVLGFAATQLKRRNIIEIVRDDMRLALHRADPLPPTSSPRPRVLLTLEVQEDLEALEAALIAAGAELERRITDEAWGKSLAVRDPDGLLIQINCYDRELDPIAHHFG
jgi:uncharacterized glyoxalase superfamily protein PhnB